MSSARNTFGNIFTSVALYPISFIASIIIARYLGPEDRGIYTYIVTLISFLIPIFSLGLGGGFIYFISKGDFLPEEVIFTIFLCSLCIGILCAGVFFFLWFFNFLGESLLILNWLELTYIIFSILFSSIYFFGNRILIGSNNFKTTNAINIGRNLLMPILTLVTVYFFSMRLEGAFLTILIVNIFFSLLMGIYFFKKNNIINRFNFLFFRGTFKYGLKGWFGDMATRTNVRMDQIILGATLPVANLGIYSISVILSELIWIVPDAIGPVLFNRITKMNDNNTRLFFTTRITRLLFWFSIILGIILFAFSYFIIIPYGYGIEYLSALNFLWFLIPAAIAMVFTKTTTKILSGTGSIGKTSTIQVYSSLVGFACTLFLIVPFGALGAAFATLISYLTGAFYSFIYLRRNFGLNFRSWVILDKDDLKWVINTIKTINK